MKVVAMIAVACALAAGFVVAGWAGLLVGAAAVAVVSMVVVRAVIPPAPPAPRRSRPPADDGTWPFASYRRIRAALGWADVSARHFDRATRPVFLRLAPDPVRARLVLGEELWPLLDPDRPASSDSEAPGVDVATLTRIVDRLEQR